MINNSIDKITFPDAIKRQMSFQYLKKDDHLSKENYRPISIWPCLSKVYEKVLAIQLGEYFEQNL